jgi:uncharacterized membrane protein YhfC
MIPLSTIIAFAVAAVCTLLVPIVLLIILGVKRKISGLTLLIGATCFGLSQFCLRLPLINILSGQSWYRTLATNTILYVLVLALSAGLFEESARLICAHKLKNHRSYKDMISFGLGHGLCEVILLVGFSHINNIALCLLINSGGAIPGIAPELLETATAQLMSVNPAFILWGILERFSTVIFHIFATVLVFTGVKKGKLHYYFLALLAHTVMNFGVVLLAQFAGIAVSEIVLLIAAVPMGYSVMISKRSRDTNLQ